MLYKNGKMQEAMRNANITTGVELAKKLDISPTEINRYLGLKKGPLNSQDNYYKTIVDISVYLNTLITDLFPAEFLDEPVLDEEELPEYYEVTNQYNEELMFVLSFLTPLQQEVIEQRFGLNGLPLTLDDIASSVNTTREQIRQIEAKALRKIRNEPNLKELLFNS